MTTHVSILCEAIQEEEIDHLVESWIDVLISTEMCCSIKKNKIKKYFSSIIEQICNMIIHMQRLIHNEDIYIYIYIQRPGVLMNADEEAYSDTLY